MRELIWGAMYLALSGSIWGGMFVTVRVAVTVIPPVPLVWLRYLTAALALYLIGCLRGVSWRVARRDWKLLFLIGLIGQTLSIVTQETGTMLTSAQTGSIITAASPAFMLVFARLLLGEAFTLGRAAAVVLATVGVLLIVVDPENVQIASAWGGISLLIAALTWALMSVLLKKLPAYSPIVVTFYGVLVAWVLLLPYAVWWLAQTPWEPLLAPQIWSSVLYMGVISTTCGFCLWNKGLLLMDASIGGLFLFFQPVVGTFLGWLLLGEPVTRFFWLGSALIAAGVVLAMRGGHSTASDLTAEQH